MLVRTTGEDNNRTTRQNWNWLSMWNMLTIQLQLSFWFTGEFFMVHSSTLCMWVYHAGALKIYTGKFLEADALLTMPLTKSLHLPEVQPLMSVQCYLTLNKW